MVLHSNVLYNIRKHELDRNLNDLFSCPSICVALAAVLRQWKLGIHSYVGYKYKNIDYFCKASHSSRFAWSSNETSDMFRVQKQ